MSGTGLSRVRTEL